MTTVRALLDEGARAISGGEPRREAALLLRHVLGVSDAWLVAHADDVVDSAQTVAYHALIGRRARGEPVAYLVGTRGFRDLELEVTPDVLIPRPETELLVELALRRIPADAEYAVADLGTGSGAIALAIAQARPHAWVVATDASAAALAVARGNAARLGIGNVEFRQGSWCAPLAGARFGLIVSNPPYIAADDPHLGEGDLRYEPPAALSSGADGLDAIRVIIRDARAHVHAGGWLLIEHGYGQGAAVHTLLRESGWSEVFTKPDLAGRERVSGARMG